MVKVKEKEKEKVTPVVKQSPVSLVGFQAERSVKPDPTVMRVKADQGRSRSHSPLPSRLETHSIERRGGRVLDSGGCDPSETSCDEKTRGGREAGVSETEGRLQGVHQPDSDRSCRLRQEHSDGPPPVPAGSGQSEDAAQVRAGEQEAGQAVLHVRLGAGRD